jgi:UDP-N-acetylglucosamine transferase subunit ALG13
VILVTLGTHPQPMDRLVVALDELLASGAVQEDVVITAATYGRRPSLARALGIQPYTVLSDMARSARAIITHGGPASIALALSVGRSPIVVPRDPTFGEHVDDHQLRFAAWLAKSRGITIVLDMAGLKGALEETLSAERQRTVSPAIPEQAITRLRSIVSDGR